MDKFQYKGYRDYLMKEPLKAITIGYVEVSEEKRMEAKKRIKETQKQVNMRLEKIAKSIF